MCDGTYDNSRTFISSVGYILFHKDACKASALEKPSVSAKGLNLPALMSQHIRPKYIFIYIYIYEYILICMSYTFKITNIMISTIKYFSTYITTFVWCSCGKVVCNTDSSYCFSSAKGCANRYNKLWFLHFIITVRRQKFGSASTWRL